MTVDRQDVAKINNKKAMKSFLGDAQRLLLRHLLENKDVN